MAYGDWKYYQEQMAENMAKMVEQVNKTLAKTSEANEMMTIAPVFFDTLHLNSYAFSTLVHNMRDYNSYTREYSYPSLDKIEAVLKEKADEITAKIPANDKKIEHNIKVRNGLESLFERLGFPRTYYVNEKVRGRTKSIERTSGWVESLYKIPVNRITIADVSKMVESALEEPRKYFAKRKADEEAARIKAEKEEKARAANTRLIHFIKLLDLAPDSDWDDVFDALLKRNKYYALAHYLHKNRQDWSDGSFPAEVGLSLFTVETKQDRMVADSVAKTIANYDGDGTIFRDCEYDYERLYQMAQDYPLYKECQEVAALIER